ncbi:hypothetical protein A3709_19660 [Halioglobus sp. HI00S01]|nr:hypothetical protein A3709_19660 [Halioglobus sp. HI00S01]
MGQENQQPQDGRLINGVKTLTPFYAAVTATGTPRVGQHLKELIDTARDINREVLKKFADTGIDLNAIERASMVGLVNRSICEMWVEDEDLSPGLADTFFDAGMAIGIAGETITCPEMMLSSVDIALDAYICSSLFAPMLLRLGREELQYTVTDSVRTIRGAVSEALECLIPAVADEVDQAEVEYALLLASADIYRACWDAMDKEFAREARLAVADNREPAAADYSQISHRYAETFNAFINVLLITVKTEAS